MYDIIAFFSFTLAVFSIGIVLLIYQRQSEQSTRIENITTKINEYVTQQKKKENRLQVDYARGVLGLINYARMSVHGLNVQIKFLKELLGDPPKKFRWKKRDLEKEESHRKQFVFYQNQLKETMARSSITRDMILELFDEPTQLLYDKMWKMFVFTDALLTMGEDFYESLMKHFINVGVEASEELHKKMLEYIPDSQKAGFALQTVEVINRS